MYIKTLDDKIFHAYIDSDNVPDYDDLNIEFIEFMKGISSCVKHKVYKDPDSNSCLKCWEDTKLFKKTS